MAKLDEKEWTLMFYFASDTPLAPEIVSQLKSIKHAGFQSEVNVIAQFDPNSENAQTHIFDVNRIEKIEAEHASESRTDELETEHPSENGSKSKIGFIGFTANDPFIVNLMADKLWGEQRDINGEFIRDRIIESVTKPGVGFTLPKPPQVSISETESETGNPDELGPQRSLESFLTFCSENYPARHYMLFILGHGLVVANDTFLFDENAPEHFLKLKPLRELLEKFKRDIETRDGKKTGAQFELISFHSCSMSSLEVAFELQNTANYMLSSQSPSFVGSWPYRQILMSIFNYQNRTERGEPKDVKRLLKNIFHYCLYNGYDFLVAGYSSDLCLCDLNEVSNVQTPLSELSATLIKGLNSKDSLLRERILLAHLDAQSYFNENYTDLFDFCFCLQRRLRAVHQEALPAEWQTITDACQKVMGVLEKGVKGNDDARLVVRSDFVGPAFQYSHGLSIFFPWSKPIKREFWPVDYNEYKFVKDLTDAKKPSWSDFLKTYFEATRRSTRADELTKTTANGAEKDAGRLELPRELLEAFATDVFERNGQLSKPGPDSSQGASCECQSIKNYPRFTREPQPYRIKGGK